MDNVSAALSQIQAVSPKANGLLVRDFATRATWIISYSSEPNQAEIDAAQAALTAFDPTLEPTRISSIVANPGLITILNKLLTASSSQIDTWFDANVTTLATAKEVLKSMAKVMVLMIRQLGW